MFYKEQLKEIHSALQDHLEDLKKEIDQLPEGSLLIYDKRGKRYYCQRFRAAGNQKKERRPSINNDPELILALVRKKYVQTAIDSVKGDIAAMENMISVFEPVGEEAVMESFCRKYPELTKGLFYGRIDPEKWATEFTPQEGFYEEDLKSTSVQGERMRSGGEMYISSRLDHFGIPYRYEAKLNIPDVDYAPDFTILRPRDQKIIYWEHFGMVNDMPYVSKNINKVSDYIDYGIRPWDNLIMTYNNERGGYDGRLIEALIKVWLL